MSQQHKKSFVTLMLGTTTHEATPPSLDSVKKEICSTKRSKKRFKLVALIASSSTSSLKHQLVHAILGIPYGRKYRSSMWHFSTS